MPIANGKVLRLETWDFWGAGQTHDRRDTNTAFPERKLLTSERLVIRKALAAVITREDHKCVISLSRSFQRSQNFSNTFIHARHHLRIGFQRTAGGETIVSFS